MIIPSRRGFLGGLLAVIAAPAIIRPGILMPIKPSLVPAPQIIAGPLFVGGQYEVLGISQSFRDGVVLCDLDLREVFLRSDEMLPSHVLDGSDILAAERSVHRDANFVKGLDGKILHMEGPAWRMAKVTVSADKIQHLLDPFLLGKLTIQMPLEGA